MSKTLQIIIGIMVIVVIIVLVVVFYKPAPKEAIKIGFIGPLTGDAAVWGKDLKLGIDMAAQQINDKGGINGRAVTVIYEDDKGLPIDGVSAAKKLIEVDKVKYILGVANSSVALSIVPLLTDHKVILISGGASSPNLTNSSPYFFRTWPSDIEEALIMAKFAASKYKRLAILYINNEYGIGLKDPLIKEFTGFGGEIVVIESFEQGAVDFRTQLTKINNEKPDAIFLITNPREGARCIKQSKELNIKAQILSHSGIIAPEVIEIAGSSANGVLLVDSSIDYQSKELGISEFLDSFRSFYGKDPGILAIAGYDSLQILATAIKKVGEDPDKIRSELLKDEGFEAASGRVKFTEGGDIKRPVRISIIQDGEFKEYTTVK